jgi:hypothetical protein
LSARQLHFVAANRSPACRQNAPSIGGVADVASSVDSALEDMPMKAALFARGAFTSVSDLKRKLMRYIRQYNKSPRTVKWKYADPSRHISTQSVGTGH